MSEKKQSGTNNPERQAKPLFPLPEKKRRMRAGRAVRH